MSRATVWTHCPACTADCAVLADDHGNHSIAERQCEESCALTDAELLARVAGDVSDGFHEALVTADRWPA